MAITYDGERARMRWAQEVSRGALTRSAHDATVAYLAPGGDYILLSERAQEAYRSRAAQGGLDWEEEAWNAYAEAALGDG